MNLKFWYGLIPTSNKSTRITRNRTNTIDRIIKNTVLKSEFKTDIKTNISNQHFSLLDVVDTAKVKLSNICFWYA